jgi:putative DNA primase/helicase
MAHVVVGPQEVPQGKNQHHNIAMVWYDARISVVPIQANGTKRPTRDWSSLQHTPMSRSEVEWYWRPGEQVGVALICGAVSGNLELTELEEAGSSPAAFTRIQEECEKRSVLDIWEMLTIKGYAEWTPSGGIHLLYRILDHEVPGNTKLAATSSSKTLAETRGEGGYVIVAPTTGICHPSGDAWTTVAGRQGEVPTITWEQRQGIHAAITAALDESPPPPPVQPRREIVVRTHDDLRPGDHFNEQASWEDPWFTNQGWQVSHRVLGETFWTRPGKDAKDGHSATTGYQGDTDNLYIWSTSAGLPTEQPLTKFFVYAWYYHNADMSAAGRALHSQGYRSSPTSANSNNLRELSLDVATSTNQEVALPGHGGLDLTDTGNGRRMKQLFGNKFRFSTKENRWYWWTGHAWELDERQEIQRAAEQAADAVLTEATQHLNDAMAAYDPKSEEVKMAKKQYGDAKNGLNHYKLTAAISRFSTQVGVSVIPEDFDQTAELLNLPNGTLNLATQELLPHDPEDMLTLTFGAEYDKDAQAPMWEGFMRDAIPDISVREYVQRALGYSLLGNPNERTMFMLHGPSGTGKSVLTSVMTRVFGGYGATAPATTFRLQKDSSSFDLHQLRGRRFVATSEMPEGVQLDEELVKRLTGGDQLTSRGLYENFQKWNAQCVIWIATNFLPRVNSDDNAIWRRAKTISMDTEFGSNGRPEIRGYADYLVKEASGILNWLLVGLAAYHERGLDEPDAVTRDIESYRVDVDTVASFVRDFAEDGALIRESEAEVKSSVLSSMYEAYCTANRITPLGGRRYANRLKALGYQPVKVGGVAMWRGLRNNPEHGFTGSMR